MGQRSIRFPDDLEAAVEAEATTLDRSFSWVVLNAVRAELGRGKRTLESALGSKESGGPSGGDASRAAPAPSRAPASRADAFRQARPRGKS